MDGAIALRELSSCNSLTKKERYENRKRKGRGKNGNSRCNYTSANRFRRCNGLGKFSGEYFSLSAGVNTTPLFIGLEGNLCQCPHWGYVLKGQITTTDAKGIEETVNPQDLFFWPAGYNVMVNKDAEIIMFSPQHEHTKVINHMIEKTK